MGGVREATQAAWLPPILAVAGCRRFAAVAGRRRFADVTDLRRFAAVGGTPSQNQWQRRSAGFQTGD